MDKYIFLKRKALNLDECEHIISYFKKSNTSGWDVGQKRVEKELGRTCVSGSLQLPYFSSLKLVLHDAIDEYVNKHHQFLHNLDFFCIEEGFNIQWSEPGEGYFMEHCEYGAQEYKLKRILAWMIYLNDIKYKGGTCWPQQHYTSKPRAGDLYVWPANWTHSHYGVSAPKETKILTTGWVSFPST